MVCSSGAGPSGAVRPEQLAGALQGLFELIGLEAALDSGLECRLCLDPLLDEISWLEIGLFSFRPTEKDYLTN